MRRKRIYILIICIFSSFMYSCSDKKPTVTNRKNDNREISIRAVSYADFEKFVQATEYITDAERYGWSIVQQDVFNYKVIKDATWKKPDGLHSPESKNLPVNQVSYNDAIAYCKWANTRLPTYDEYWELIKNDKRKVITDNKGPISKVDDVNLLGNVWEITQTVFDDSVRLAGGSLFCSKNTCHGTSKERELYVDRETGNIHIGFAVIPLS